MKKYYKVKDAKPSFPYAQIVETFICSHNRWKSLYQCGFKPKSLLEDGVCEKCREYKERLSHHLYNLNRRQEARRRKREVHYHELELACCLNCEHYIHYEFYCKKNHFHAKWGSVCDDWEQKTDQGVRI